MLLAAATGAIAGTALWWLFRSRKQWRNRAIEAERKKDLLIRHWPREKAIYALVPNQVI